MENNIENDYSHIKGWGIDADPENEPTYPMKKYTGDDHNRLNYERPPQQPLTVEVLHSNERPTVSAVFGTPEPPSGLSGVLRRQAFKYSEGKWAHWLILLMADRVNVMEGLVDDLKNGHVPNLFGEHGLKADWKYNKKGFVQKAAVRVIAVAVVVALISKKHKKKKKERALQANWK